MFTDASCVPRIGLLLSRVTPTGPCEGGLFSRHRGRENEAHGRTAGQNALAAVSPEGSGWRARTKSSRLRSPKPLVSFGGHSGMWMLFGEIILTLAQTIASPPQHTRGAAWGTMAKENGV